MSENKDMRVKLLRLFEQQNQRLREEFILSLRALELSEWGPEAAGLESQAALHQHSHPQGTSVHIHAFISINWGRGKEGAFISISWGRRKALVGVGVGEERKMEGLCWHLSSTQPCGLSLLL